MQAVQTDKQGRGGFREGAGRKPTGCHPTVAVRVDERLLPILNVIKSRGVDDVLLTELDAIVTAVDLKDSLTELYKIPSKNRGRDVQKYIKQACNALNLNPDNLDSKQKFIVLNWHKGQTK